MTLSQREQEVYDLLCMGKSQRDVARELGLNRGTIGHTATRIKNKGYELPNSHTDMTLQGQSRMRRDENGCIVWDKYSKDKQTLELQVEAWLEGMKDEVPRAPRRSAKKAKGDLANLYTLTDLHLGMKSWREETGADWDIKIAERMALECFQYLIDVSPPADTCILSQLGDYEHFDGMFPVTPTSGHMLDADTRAALMVRVGARLIRNIISMLSEKYAKVVVVVSSGNHNPFSSVKDREWLSLFYERDDRVDVVTDSNEFRAIEWGTTMLGFTHGHLPRNRNVVDCFINRHREMYGRTKRTIIHTGHRHHQEIKDKGTALVETHASIAAPDAYAASHGFHSDRRACCITYHQKHGEVARHWWTPDRLA